MRRLRSAVSVLAGGCLAVAMAAAMALGVVRAGQSASAARLVAPAIAAVPALHVSLAVRVPQASSDVRVRRAAAPLDASLLTSDNAGGNATRSSGPRSKASLIAIAQPGRTAGYDATAPPRLPN